MNIRLAAAALSAGLLLTACADDVVVDGDLDTTSEAPADDMGTEDDMDATDAPADDMSTEGDVDVDVDVDADDAATEDHSEG